MSVYILYFYYFFYYSIKLLEGSIFSIFAKSNLYNYTRLGGPFEVFMTILKYHNDDFVCE